MTAPIITLCTYNESENVRELIPEIFEHARDAHVLVIDDNSPDGTGDVVREMMNNDSRIHLLSRAGKEGLGKATVAGFQWVIDHGGFDLVINLDADFSHPPKYLPAIREALERVDVAVASRYVDGGGIVGWNFKRHFMSQGINWYSRLLLGLRTRDCSGAFRGYRIEKLAKIDWSKVRSTGYSFQEEVLYLCKQAGCTFEEVPFTFEDRRHGETKLDKSEAIRSLWHILLLAFDRLDSRRVLLPGQFDERTAQESLSIE